MKMQSCLTTLLGINSTVFMISGLKTKDGIQDDCQNKIFLKILIVLPYIYTVYIYELLLD